jgi:hypothetical protein
LPKNAIKVNGVIWFLLPLSFQPLELHPSQVPRPSVHHQEQPAPQAQPVPQALLAAAVAAVLVLLSYRNPRT